MNIQEALSMTQGIVIQTEKPKKTRQPRVTSIEKESVSNLKFEIRKEREALKKYEEQDESNFTDFEKGVKGKEVNMKLIHNHIAYYQGFIDAKREPQQALLEKWRGFIVNLCLEKGQEIDKIWFDESAPFDCAVNLRMKGHCCWYHCVNFRFEGGKLKAYDSHFGGGTSFVWFNHLEYQANPKIEEDTIREVMEKVFKNECCGENTEAEHKEHLINERGWIID